jgi:hypothetical protein
MREGTMRKLATDRAGLEILHLGDCFSLLESVPVGRIGPSSITGRRIAPASPGQE